LEELYLFPAFSFHAVIDILQTRQDSGFSSFLVRTLKGIQGDIDLFGTFPISVLHAVCFYAQFFKSPLFLFEFLESESSILVKP
jgi:hypothetical protein